MKEKKTCKDCFFYYEGEPKVVYVNGSARLIGNPKCGFIPGGVKIDKGAPICGEFSKTWEV